MFRVTEYRTDGELCDRLVGRSRDAMRWLHKTGMKFDPIWGRQAYLIDGKFKFWAASPSNPRAAVRASSSST